MKCFFFLALSLGATLLPRQSWSQSTDCVRLLVAMARNIGEEVTVREFYDEVESGGANGPGIHDYKAVLIHPLRALDIVERRQELIFSNNDENNPLLVSVNEVFDLMKQKGFIPDTWMGRQFYLGYRAGVGGSWLNDVLKNHYTIPVVLPSERLNPIHPWDSARTRSIRPIPSSSGNLAEFPAGSSQMSVQPSVLYQNGHFVKLPDGEIRTPVGSQTIRDLWISQYQTTQLWWVLVMGKHASEITTNGWLSIAGRQVSTERPVTNVTMAQISQFIRRLNKMHNTQWEIDRARWVEDESGRSASDFSEPYLEFRLPNELEWEYAARAGRLADMAPSQVRDYAVLAPENFQMAMIHNYPVYRTFSVGSKKPNDWELYDTLGNVFEITDGSRGDGRVALKGGSYLSATGEFGFAESVIPGWSHLRWRESVNRRDIGFRLVATLRYQSDR